MFSYQLASYFFCTTKLNTFSLSYKPWNKNQKQWNSPFKNCSSTHTPLKIYVYTPCLCMNQSTKKTLFHIPGRALTTQHLIFIHKLVALLLNSNTGVLKFYFLLELFLLLCCFYFFLNADLALTNTLTHTYDFYLFIVHHHCWCTPFYKYFPMILFFSILHKKGKTIMKTFLFPYHQNTLIF